LRIWIKKIPLCVHGRELHEISKAIAFFAPSGVVNAPIIGIPTVRHSAVAIFEGVGQIQSGSILVASFHIAQGAVAINVCAIGRLVTLVKIAPVIVLFAERLTLAARYTSRGASDVDPLAMKIFAIWR
jgi:hypothetical protein